MPEAYGDRERSERPSGDGSKNLRLVVSNPAKRPEPPAPKPPELPNIVRLIALARKWQPLIERGEFRSGAAIARHMRMGAVRVSNILCLLKLHPDILAHLADLPAGAPERYLTERWFRPLTKLSHAEQLKAFSERLQLRRGA